MKQFNTSKDIYEAGYALPTYSIERTTRAWRYQDEIFDTSLSVPVEQVLYQGNVLDVLPMKTHDA
jgi:hypothetical protein